MLNVQKFLQTNSIEELSKPPYNLKIKDYPEEELVVNYFRWRYQDWLRNSIQMLAQSHFSHKQLDKKNSNGLHKMLYTKNVNWTDLEDRWKNGIFSINGIISESYSPMKDYVYKDFNKFLYPGEDENVTNSKN